MEEALDLSSDRLLNNNNNNNHYISNKDPFEEGCKEKNVEVTLAATTSCW